MRGIEARGVAKSYLSGSKQIDVLRSVDLDVQPGEMVAIIGASGVGKSTLLHVLGGLDAFDAGSIYLGETQIHALTDEARVRFRNRHVGFVFQFHHLLPEFTALENVEMPLRIAGTAAAERQQRAQTLLDRVGLSNRASHRPSALSGGEQQRVAIARALVARPSLILADEPTGNLDEATAADLHRLLRDMHAEYGLTSLIATHNPSLAAACDRILRLEEGRLTPA
ncbi:MAG: ABC transporter ATP-binding protein [Acidobacteria bacterium]|jgi:lipoprotein-releasing system ATP-binding protein|nr:ABC transporter ATP-binding protein [Acidobacteriota bacterium]